MKNQSTIKDFHNQQRIIAIFNARRQNNKAHEKFLILGYTLFFLRLCSFHGLQKPIKTVELSPLGKGFVYSTYQWPKLTILMVLKN